MMKSVAILSLLISAFQLGAATQCNADNCARAVTGTFQGLQATHLADCKSFVQCTSTAALLSVTTTVTVTPAPATVTAVATQPESFVSVTDVPSSTITLTVPAADQTVTVTVQPPLTVATVTVTPPPVTVVASRGFGARSPSTLLRKRNACKRKTTSSSPTLSESASTYSNGTSSTIASDVSITTTPATTSSTIVSVSSSSSAAISTAPITTTTSAPDVTCPTAIPSYASACSGIARYASACSCAGYTRSTTTVGLSTVTSTVTVTALQQTLTSVVTLEAPIATVTVTAPAQIATVISTAEPIIRTVTQAPPPQVSTVTVTAAGSTVTVNVPQPYPTLCGNAGFQWAYFRDTTGGDLSTSQQQLSVDPDSHKQDTPFATGATNFLRIDGNEPYGNSGIGSTDYIIEHRGFIFAPETGDYTFVGSNVKDLSWTWIGSSAYSGWNKGNSNSYISAVNSNPISSVFRMRLQAGQYYPVRVVYKQGTGRASFSYSITSPSGLVLIGSDPNAVASPLAVQYSCDGVLAPQYPPFGQET